MEDRSGLLGGSTKIEYHQIYELAEDISKKTEEKFIIYITSLEKEIVDLKTEVLSTEAPEGVTNALLSVLDDLLLTTNRLSVNASCENKARVIKTCIQALCCVCESKAVCDLVSKVIDLVDKTEVFAEMSKVRQGLSLVMGGCQLPAREETRRLPRINV